MGWYTTLVVVLSSAAAVSILMPLPKVAMTVQLLRMSYVCGFSCAFGCSIWVTFVAGVVLFRSLPRHQFGLVQSQLFPAYFSFVAASVSITLASFAALHPLPSASLGECWQMAALAAASSGALLNLLLLEPITTKVMRERHRIEKEAGIGTEIGLSRNKEIAKTNPELAAVNKRFGMYHGMSSVANLIGLVGLTAHAYHLASTIEG